MESWLVRWRDSRDQEQQQEYASFLEAWTFNEESLKGKGEVTLLTDRAPISQERAFRSEAAAARQQEGSRRYVRKKT